MDQVKPIITVCGRGNSKSIRDTNKILNQIEKEDEDSIHYLRVIQKIDEELKQAIMEEIDREFIHPILDKKPVGLMQKYPSILSKSIGSQKTLKKPYKQRLKYVNKK